jgi:hypothetical protein
MQKKLEPSIGRPVTVTIMAVFVLIIPVMNLIRVWAAFEHWETLTGLEVHPGPLYITLTGIFWVIAGSWLFWMIWNGQPKARISGLILTGLYVIYYWIDRLVFQNHISRENTPFTLGMTILVVFYTVLSLSLPANQAYFLRKNEQ